MNNPDHFFKLRNNFFWFFGIKIFKFFDEDPRSEISLNQIWDPGSGMEKSWIRNPVLQEA
jgi:hypothetical protein